MTGSDTIVEAFTDLAPRYEEVMDGELRRYWGISYEGFIDRLIELASVNEGDVILDVATGTASIPRRLASVVAKSGRVVGLDVTLAMLEHGRKNIEATGASSCAMVCASAMTIPLVEGAFDVVICGLGTHHMNVPQMLSEMKRVLKEGGKLALADVGASAFWRSFWGIALLKILLIPYRLTHRSSRAQAEQEAFPSVRTAGEWRAILSDIGFSKIEITESRARHPWYPCALTIRAVA